ncbi:mrpl-1 [Pristionchus pacificus]|uniref:Mrpl-1 n=1 Tax=Pristionchus pacificus TaxID=54126 RepID=A0A2A6BW64_PRIPA|nr:mrpl-1 [Pristionchus pacificus]|eukprot:PDM70033.1 mrpl-1 [Pristionchus pacificus]
MLSSLLRNWTGGLSRTTALTGDLLVPSSLEITNVRGRKRALKQTITRQQKLERRLKREEREAARKQFSFMERINIRRMKSLLSPSQQYPGRLNRDEEEALPEQPLTNVFIRSHVKTQFYSVAKAIDMHRELQHPSIYNNPKAPLRLRLELNMTTEKQTKMVGSSDEIVPVPHPFSHNEKRTILAFVNDLKLQEVAVEAGAEIAVGQDMIKKIIKGQFRVDDYDFCVAHQDMATHILPLRGILKTRFPTRINGGPGVPHLGPLNMDPAEVEANIGAVVAAACAHRNAALGPFVNRALLMTIPGEEHYALDVAAWMPVPSEEELEKLERRRNKKGKKKDEKKTEGGEDEEGAETAAAAAAATA